MKQLVLTEEQHELLGKMERIFEEAKEKGISFMYDINDGSLTAFNSSNVCDFYAGRNKEDDDDEEIDFDSCSIIENASIDYVDYARQEYYLKFE
jgi:hypothetical protein